MARRFTLILGILTGSVMDASSGGMSHYPEWSWDDRDGIVAGARNGYFMSRVSAVRQMGESGDPSYLPVLQRLTPPEVGTEWFFPALCLAKAQLRSPHKDSREARIEYLRSMLDGVCVEDCEPTGLRLWAAYELVNMGDQESLPLIEERLPVWRPHESRREEIRLDLGRKLSYSADGIPGLLRAAASDDQVLSPWAFEQLSLTRGTDRELAKEGLRQLVARVESEYLALHERGEVEALDPFELLWKYRYSRALSVLAELGGENRFAQDRVIGQLTRGGSRPRMWHPPPPVPRPGGRR